MLTNRLEDLTTNLQSLTNKLSVLSQSFSAEVDPVEIPDASIPSQADQLFPRRHFGHPSTSLILVIFGLAESSGGTPRHTRMDNDLHSMVSILLMVRLLITQFVIVFNSGSILSTNRVLC